MQYLEIGVRGFGPALHPRAHRLMAPASVAEEEPVVILKAAARRISPAPTTIDCGWVRGVMGGQCSDRLSLVARRCHKVASLCLKH